MKKKGSQGQSDQAKQIFQAGYNYIRQQPGFDGILREVQIHTDHNRPMAKRDWAFVTSGGDLYINFRITGSPGEWAYILAHCCLHLAMGHFQSERLGDSLWNLACDCSVARFLAESKIGTPPPEISDLLPVGAKDEDGFYSLLKSGGWNPPAVSTMTCGHSDMVDEPPANRWRWHHSGAPDWAALFSKSLQDSIRKAVLAAGGVDDPDNENFLLRPATHPAELARRWFVDSYPLLGAVASRFRIITDGDVTSRLGVPVAAVSARMAEIYINPQRKFSQDEWRFLIAHELLHAALRHDIRCEEREPELWNIACDFVINDWLRQMDVGAMPEGVLYDPAFVNLSAEAVYDKLAEDLKFWKNRGECDIIFDGDGWYTDEARALDDYYRSALQRGLSYQQESGRGLMPAGLVEDIWALAHPPIPWDVELAKWFDAHFVSVEKRRTYARLSRRQSATPDIPRPAWRKEELPEGEQTFGVLLDTSGSMDRHLLATALGAIASYSDAGDVRCVRVVFCDAHPYDQGMMEPSEIAGRVTVRGRGGTKLQPGIDLLDRDPLFPKDAPLLIITDGECDRLTVRGREHAYLTPKGRRLPFHPKGPVFRLT